MTETDLRNRLLAVAKKCYERDFIAGASGNISARLTADQLLITPSGANKADLTPEDLLVIDLQGVCINGDPACRPTSELPMHLEIYARRPEVGAVVHAHPITCVALSLVGISMHTPYLPEALVFLGPVPTTPYANPSSTENSAAIRGLISDHDAIILAHHGSLTVGRTLEEAYSRLEILEHAARTIALAHQLGQPRTLSEEAVSKLLRARAGLGLARPGEDSLTMRVAAEVERVTLDLAHTGW